MAIQGSATGGMSDPPRFSGVGDVRFERPYERLAHAPDRAAELQNMSDEAIIMALAASRQERDPYLANVLASEAMNRMLHKNAIIETVGEGIISIDPDANVRYVNPAAERLLGRTLQDMVGRRAHDVTHHHRVNGHVFPADECPVEAILRGGPAVSRYETTLWRSDGTCFLAEVNAAPVLRDGEIQGAVTTFTDITERRRSERDRAYLAAIVQGTDDAVFGKTLDGIVTSWNPGAERLYGYAPEEIIGRSVEMLVPPDRVNDVPEILRRIRRGERIQHHLTQRMAKDGRILDVSLTISPIADASGRLVGASTIARHMPRAPDE